jgi:hypothetical protein
MSDRTIAYEDNVVTIGQKLARLMDVSPFLFWSQAEANGFEDIEELAPFLPDSPRTRRLQFAYAMAVEAGMPSGMRLSVLAGWSALLLRRLPA